jgi:hypothetical protein
MKPSPMRPNAQNGMPQAASGCANTTIDIGTITIAASTIMPGEGPKHAEHVAGQIPRAIEQRSGNAAMDAKRQPDREPPHAGSGLSARLTRSEAQRVRSRHDDASPRHRSASTCLGDCRRLLLTNLRGSNREARARQVSRDRFSRQSRYQWLVPNLPASCEPIGAVIFSPFAGLLEYDRTATEKRPASLPGRDRFPRRRQGVSRVKP